MKAAHRHEVAAEEHGCRPVECDARLAVERGDLHEVIRAVHKPRGPATKFDAKHVCDALVESKRSDKAEVAVLVFARRAAPQVHRKVLAQTTGLADCMLGARRAVSGLVLGEIGHLSTIARNPRPRDHRSILGSDL